MTSDDLVSSLSINRPTRVSQPRAKRPKGNHYVPGFPSSILTSVVEARAEAVLPLVLAIHRQLTMANRVETPLNEAIWSAAGYPSHKKRASILRKLKSLPEVIELIPDRTPISHFRVKKGCLWSLPELPV